MPDDGFEVKDAVKEWFWARADGGCISESIAVFHFLLLENQLSCTLVTVNSKTVNLR